MAEYFEYFVALVFSLPVILVCAISAFAVISVYEKSGLVVASLSSFIIGAPVWGIAVGIIAYMNGKIEANPMNIGIGAGAIIGFTIAIRWHLKSN